MSRMHEYGHESMRERAGETIQEHPDEAVLIALAAGAVIGFIIGSALAGGEESKLRHSRRVAEGLGERLLSSFESMIPDTLSKSLGMHR